MPSKKSSSGMKSRKALKLKESKGKQVIPLLAQVKESVIGSKNFLNILTSRFFTKKTIIDLKEPLIFKDDQGAFSGVVIYKPEMNDVIIKIPKRILIDEPISKLKWNDFYYIRMYINDIPSLKRDLSDKPSAYIQSYLELKDEGKYPSFYLEDKYNLTFGMAHEILDILKDAKIYDSFYSYENIESITPLEEFIEQFIFKGESTKEFWHRITMKNGKTFDLIFRIGGYTSWNFRLQGNPSYHNEIVQYLSGEKYDPEVESYGGYKELFKAIKDKNPKAMVMFKQSVDQADWSYWASDDPRYYWGGEWEHKTLKKFAELLGQEAQDYYEEIGKKKA